MNGEADALSVAIIGCGFVGHKRAQVIGGDQLVGCFDTDLKRAQAFAEEFGTKAYESVDALLEQDTDVVIVATTHDCLASNAVKCLESGAHVLVEKPAATSTAELDEIIAASKAADRKVKVGYNHRFYPGIADAVNEASSGRHGDVMFLRARYGHGGRLGYEKEWRMNRAVSGGGELIDQGMHLLDLSYWLHGPLPVHSALLRTNYWNIDVEDNAVVILGEQGQKTAPWSMLHVTWTEWKNMFSLEIYCKSAKLQVDGLSGSYGPQRYRLYKMKPELGPPDLVETDYPPIDDTWRAEWQHFRTALLSVEESDALGDLESARYALSCVESAYRLNTFGDE